MGKSDELSAKSGKEIKSAGVINHFHVDKADDGSYIMHTSTDKGASQKTTHPDHKHLLAAIQDNLTSPHLPAMGQKFTNLEPKLMQGPKVPAFIGRKKFGVNQFDALSH